MLDSGDLFHLHPNVSQKDREHLDAKAEVILKSYAKAGCKGVAVGDRDLGLYGVEGLKKLAAKASFPFLCANLVDDKQQMVFTPNVTVDAAGYTVGIFGLITPGATPGEGYQVTDAVKAAAEQVKALENQKVDLIVMLAHLDRRDASLVMKAHKGIDLALGGQSMGSSRFLEKMGGGWWVESGQKGKYLNVVAAHLSTKGHKPFVVREEASKLKGELTALDSRIKRYARMAKGPARPGTRSADPSRYEGIIKSLQRQRSELVEKTKLLSRAADDAPFLSLEAVALNKKLRDDEEVGKWVSEYNKAHPKLKPSRSARRGTGAMRDAASKRTIPHKAIRTLHAADKKDAKAEKKTGAKKEAETKKEEKK